MNIIKKCKYLIEDHVLKRHGHRNFMFIHIPKTAGTSVNVILKKHGCVKFKKFDENHRRYYKNFKNKGNVTFSHLNVSILLQTGVISREYYDSSFKFAFVRNPWDRFVSTFLYRKKREMLKSIYGVSNDIPFEEFCYYMKRRGIDKPTLRMDLFNPQVSWLTDKIDFIGRFENIENDWKIICDSIGIKYESLGHYNISNRQHYSTFYQKDSEDIISELYKLDIERFDYTFENFPENG